MAIEFFCPKCRHSLRFSDDEAGLRIACSNCDELILVPRQSQSTRTPPLQRAMVKGEPGTSRIYYSIPDFVLFAGLMIMGYFSLAFDVSVRVSNSDIANLAKMNDRIVGVIVGATIAIIGTITRK